MKKLSLLFFLGLVLSGCLVDETNLDASESYLDEHGVNQSNKSRTLSFSGVIPDSLKVLRNPYTIWDKSLSLVGSDPGIGDANAGFGYILTGFASKLDSIKLNDLYKRPYVVFQFDSLFSEMSALTQSGHASTTLSYAIDYRVVLHRGLTNALYYDSLVVAVDGTGFDQNTSLFYSDLKDDSTASKSSVIYSASNQHVFNLLPSNNSSVHTELFQTGTKTLEAYRNPIKIYLDSLVGQLVAAQKDSTLHLSIILDDFGVYNPADSSIISVGLQRVAVDFPKPTLHFSDSIALSHSIDRYQLKRITEDSTQYENRIWGGLDTLSFRMPVDTLLSLFQDSLGEIKGIYSDHLVRKATVSFPIYDSSSVTELALPYTIEAKTATERLP